MTIPRKHSFSFHLSVNQNHAVWAIGVSGPQLPITWTQYPRQMKFPPVDDDYGIVIYEKKINHHFSIRHSAENEIDSV